jgi:aromatic ring-opening dioxygenase catalytic subunit (LigB family)
MNKAQLVYLSHGGGPLPILGDPGHQAMVDFMRQLPEKLARPEAILVISAHWEEKAVTLQTAAKPRLFYDYYGFPPQAYQITYPAPGNPAMAERIAALLEAAGIPTRRDPQRGFDHGVFIPLKLMYPAADIPTLQLSLLEGLDPAAHLALGRALRPLLTENLLVIGSGSSFHNFRAFFGQGLDAQNDAFQDWLVETCTSPALTQEGRERRLLEWERAPHARYAHPREEHLLPLFVCQAMANAPAEVIFDGRILEKRNVAFLWKGA